MRFRRPCSFLTCADIAPGKLALKLTRKTFYMKDERQREKQLQGPNEVASHGAMSNIRSALRDRSSRFIRKAHNDTSRD